MYGEHGTENGAPKQWGSILPWFLLTRAVKPTAQRLAEGTALPEGLRATTPEIQLLALRGRFQSHGAKGSCGDRPQCPPPLFSTDTQPLPAFSPRAADGSRSGWHQHLPPFPEGQRVWYGPPALPVLVGEGQRVLPIFWMPGVGRWRQPAWLSQPHPAPGRPSPTSLAQGPAGEGVVLPAGAQRVRGEKPPCSNESAHSAAARRRITRRAGGGGERGRGRGRRVRRPRGPGVPACLTANRTLSAVTEAGGSWRSSPAPATRRVTRKHGAAPLPRAPASRLALPPARAAFAVLMLCFRPGTITLADASLRPRASLSPLFSGSIEKVCFSIELSRYTKLVVATEGSAGGEGPGDFGSSRPERGGNFSRRVPRHCLPIPTPTDRPVAPSTLLS